MLHSKSASIETAYFKKKSKKNRPFPSPSPTLPPPPHPPVLRFLACWQLYTPVTQNSENYSVEAGSGSIVFRNRYIGNHWGNVLLSALSYYYNIMSRYSLRVADFTVACHANWAFVFLRFPGFVLPVVTRAASVCGLQLACYLCGCYVQTRVLQLGRPIQN